jgi:hypothetical protein
LKAKIRALTHRTSQWSLAYVLTKLGQLVRGWASHCQDAVAKWTFSKLDTFTWWRLTHLLRARHGWTWGQLRRQLRTTPAGRWQIASDGIEYFRIQGVTVSRYTYRGNKIPTPWQPRTRLTTDTVESPLPRDRYGGFGERPGETDQWQHRNRVPGRLSSRIGGSYEHGYRCTTPDTAATTATSTTRSSSSTPDNGVRAG